MLRLWRPTPLVRAERLEKALGTPGAHLLQGRVGLAGRLAQAEHRRAPGLLQQAGGDRPARHRDRRRASGAAPFAFACALFGLECKVYMVRASYDQKPYRRIDDGDLGRIGRALPRRRPGQPRLARLGHLRRRRATPSRASDTHYSLGSVLNHVLLHQTVIGLEAMDQLTLAGEEPARRRHRLLRRRVEPRRHLPALRARRRASSSRGRALVVPDAHGGAPSSTTSPTSPR